MQRRCTNRSETKAHANLINRLLLLLVLMCSRDNAITVYGMNGGGSERREKEEEKNGLNVFAHWRVLRPNIGRAAASLVFFIVWQTLRCHFWMRFPSVALRDKSELASKVLNQSRLFKRQKNVTAIATPIWCLFCGVRWASCYHCTESMSFDRNDANYRWHFYYKQIMIWL